MNIARNYLQVISIVNVSNELAKHTPGSSTDAWMKEDKQTKKMYAKIMGIAGETWCHSHGALYFD